MFWNYHTLLFLSAKSKFRMNTWKSYLLYFFLYYLLVFHIESSLAACDSKNCVNGYCNTGDDECVCFAGWEGVKCDHCTGRVRLVEPSGHIHESPENYKTSRKCSWLIDSQRNDTPIHLKLEDFGTECSWDHLYIYDGDSIYSPLVAALSGPVQYQEEDIRHEFTLTSGFAYLYFYSDAAYILDGFNISYSIGDCRDRNCSGNGNCRTDTFTCECYPGWSGDGCNIQDCPNNCTMGYCINGQCVCDSGYYGRDCNTKTSEGLWEIQDEKTVFSRASAGSVVIGDELWVIGGYGFVKEESMPVYKYNFISGVSESVPVTSSSGSLPLPRYAHSAALYKDVIIVYGGTIVDGTETSEVWTFNTTTLTWSGAVNINSTAVAMQGHTAHIFNDSMLVFFGYSPTYGYVGWVQEYNILKNSWSILQTDGFPVLGAFGHSSVYSSEMEKVFVYGGYPFNRLDESSTDHLYEFDVIKQKWSILPSGTQSRFLHSAVLIGHKMYVFGGNSHTDSNEYRGAQCYSNNFMIYDTNCNAWHEEELSTGLYEQISRFGHQAVVYNDVMWLFGGYNGVMLNDIVTYTTVNCSSVVNETCELAGPGPTCMWDMDSKECHKLSLKETSQHNISFMECDATENRSNCSKADKCSSCIQLQGCGWCDGKCNSNCANESNYYTCEDMNCQFYANCEDCNRLPQCRYTARSCKMIDPSADVVDKRACSSPCAAFTSCGSCTRSNSCMWCESQNRCINSQTYLTSFVYGTCLAWVTGGENCNKIKCSDYETCETCHKDPACGWCDQGDVTGLGTCMEGGNTGPVNMTSDGAVVDLGLCPSSQWHFTGCPSCQCNGHSICLDGETCSNCSDFTTGENCESCVLGYHGTPLNGANCSACECNGHSEYCDPSSDESNCYCDTKGITGAQCDKCDEQKGYFGDPTVNTCYYQLLMNFKYTFQLDDSSGENLTKINMFVKPEVDNRDIDFTLSVNEPVNFSVSYTTSTVDEEEIIIDNMYVDSVFRYRFSRYTYDFRNEVNTTFLFYLSNFTHPFTFRVGIEILVANDSFVEDLEIYVATQSFPWLLFTFTLLTSVTFMILLWRALFVLFEWRRTAQYRAFVHRGLGSTSIHNLATPHSPSWLEYSVVFCTTAILLMSLLALLHRIHMKVAQARRVQIEVEENPFSIIVIVFGSLIGFLSFCALVLLGAQKLCGWYLDRQMAQVVLEMASLLPIWASLVFTASPLVIFFISLLVVYVRKFIINEWISPRVQVTQQIRLEDLLRFFIVFFSVFLSFMCFFAFGWKLKIRIDAYVRSQVTIYHPAGGFIAILVTFVVCFVLILTVFVIALKGRDYVDRYRRRRRREVEMAEMASRPFASIFLEIENKAPPDLIATTKSKPSTSVGVAIEPLKENKAALATVIMQLPFINGEVPVGQSRVLLGTALVTQKSKKTDSHPHVPELREPPAPRETPRGHTPNGRPNTARDIELMYDEICSEETHAYDNPAMV